MLQPRPLHLIGGGQGGRGRRRSAALLRVVDEVAPRAVGAEPDGVECAAKLCLVLGMAAEAAQLVNAMGKLALVAVLAGAVLLERPAQLCLVAARVHLTVGASRARTLLQEAIPSLGERAVSHAVLFVAAAGASRP